MTKNDCKLKLWLIERHDDGPYYDCSDEFLVRARSPRAARKIAAQATRGDEGAAPWLDPKRSPCKEIKLDGPEEVILSSFTNG